MTIRLQPLGDGLLVLGSNEPMSVVRRRGRVGRVRRRRPRHGPRRRRPRRAAGAASSSSSASAPRTSSPASRPHRRPAGACRAAVGRVGGDPAAAGDGAEGGAAQRADAAGALPRTHRLDPRGGDDARSRRSSEASATGTTGTAGSATRRCPRTPSSSSARSREAEALLRWVDACIERTGGHPERLHPLYTVDGLELGPEAVIDTLPGYAGSRPVRVGNAANRQIQLDVFGPITDLLAAVVSARGSVRNEDWRARRGDGARGRAALARARSRRLGGPAAAPAPRLLEGDVLAHGRPGLAGAGDPAAARRARTGSSCATGSARTCSSTAGTRRLVPIPSPMATRRSTRRPSGSGSPGSSPDDDPRFLATVLKIEAELRSGAVVYRYRWDDGLPGIGGRVPHLHRLADRGVPPDRQARRCGRAVPADDRDGRPDGPAARAVRPVRRARPRQPPAGLQPSRPDPLRDRPRGATGRRRLEPRLQRLRRPIRRAEARSAARAPAGSLCCGPPALSTVRLSR